MNDLYVSIILPVYNVEKYVKRCLDSVVNQTYDNIEIVIVNDCTPDNSMSIVEEYASKDSRFKIINHETNRGLMMTRKTGYKNATGDFLFFLDSDDYMPLNAIEELVNKQISTNADIVIGECDQIFNNGDKTRWHEELKYGNSSENILESLLKEEVHHNLIGKLYNKSLFSDHTYKTFDKMTIGEDACLFYQVVVNAHIIVALNEVVYYYLENVSSSTHQTYGGNQIQSIINTNSVRLDICSKFPSLSVEVDRFVTSVVMRFKCGHHIEDKLFDEMLVKVDMLKYGSFSHAFKVLSFRHCLSLLKSRYL